MSYTETYNEHGDSHSISTATGAKLFHPAMFGKTENYFDINSKLKTFSPSGVTVADNPDFS